MTGNGSENKNKQSGKNKRGFHLTWESPSELANNRLLCCSVHSSWILQNSVRRLAEERKGQTWILVFPSEYWKQFQARSVSTPILTHKSWTPEQTLRSNEVKHVQVPWEFISLNCPELFCKKWRGCPVRPLSIITLLVINGLFLNLPDIPYNGRRLAKQKETLMSTRGDYSLLFKVYTWVTKVCDMGLFTLIISFKLTIFLHKKLQGGYFQQSMVFVNSFM